MIHLYTSTRYFDTNNILVDNESFFRACVKIKELDDFSLSAIKKIDKAEIKDLKTGAIITPYGETSIFNLSTGCKTVLNCSYIARNRHKFSSIQAIVGTESGWNALDCLFEAIEYYNTDLKVILEHEDEVGLCTKRQYCVNDKHIIEALDWFYVNM